MIKKLKNLVIHLLVDYDLNHSINQKESLQRIRNRRSERGEAYTAISKVVAFLNFLFFGESNGWVTMWLW